MKRLNRWKLRCQIGRRLLLVAVLLLPNVLWARPHPAQAAGGVSPAIPVLGFFSAWLKRNQTYEAANAFIKEQNAYYGRLHDTAWERARARNFPAMGQTQGAAYIKAVALMIRERQAMEDYAESEKRAARATFQDEADDAFVNAMLSTTPMTRVLGAMRDGISSSRGMIGQALDKLSGGGGGALAEIQRVRRTASWVAIAGEIIGGEVGAEIRGGANRVVTAIDRPVSEIESGLEQVDGDLGGLSEKIDGLLDRSYRPGGREIARDAVISAATGEDLDPVMEAVVDLLGARARQRGGGFRGQARAVLTGKTVARCVAIGERYRELLNELRAKMAEGSVDDGIEPPACVMVDVDALVRSLNEDETAAGGPEDDLTEGVVTATATARAPDAPPEPEATVTPRPSATATPTVIPTASVRDPCAVMPPGGNFGTVNEQTCFATFDGGPGARRVQIDLLPPASAATTICQSMAAESDFHTVMATVSIGECGYRNDTNYQGEKMPGYEGWSIRFYRDRFVVRVSTDKEYPTDQAWIESTAKAVDESIRDHLGEATP